MRGGWNLQVLGIVGGIASGKSLIATQLGKLGADVIDADRLGHDVLLEHDVERAARERWGDGVFDPAGRIVRRRLAEIVFAQPPKGPRELTYLEQLTHPRIAERIIEQIDIIANRGGARAVAVDAPLLYKAGWDKYCNAVIFVDAPRETRLARAIARGWSEEDFAQREMAQEPLDEQRHKADLVVDNSGPPEATFRQLAQFWSGLFGPPMSKS